MVAVGHGLIGDAGRAALEHGVEQLAVGGEVEVCEEQLALADKLVFGGNRFLHLDDHVGGSVDVLDGGEDGGACGYIFRVGEAAALAGRVLNEQFMAVGHEFLHSRGGRAHAVLIVLDLFWDSDFHNACVLDWVLIR